MVRMFDTHKIRKQKELEGMWGFAPIVQKDIIPDTFDFHMPVPGCWEQHPSFLTYRGVCFYRRNIHIDKASNLRLEFKWVSHTGDIYFDGVHILKHYNAFTPFSTILTEVPKGEHEILVRVDNTFSEASALHMENDYYTYGGLIRPVVIEEIGNAIIERIEFLPAYANGIWQASIKIYVKNISNSKKDYSVKLQFVGAEYYMGIVELAAGEKGTLLKVIAFNNAEEWNDKTPKLYLLEAKLYEAGSQEPIDDLIERVGFRTIEVSGKDILLNGKPIKFIGFNRHEDFGIVGCSIPVQLMMKDLELIRQTGANSIRTSHYPNDERFLDLCDELGIFVWEENHARGLSLERMQNINFEKQCEDCIIEMVQNHYNHPSIVIWGILNECASNTVEGREIYKKQFELIRSMDLSRPLTTACCHHFEEKCFDLCDIVSMNIYSGWYNDEKIDDFYLRILKHVEATGGRNKPVIISEFGAAAIYGFREPTRVKWSEERQSDILDNCLEFYLGREEVKGTYIWQFCDCRVTEGDNWFATRARSKNNKGMVDEYRRPKLAFEVVKKHYTALRR